MSMKSVLALFVFCLVAAPAFGQIDDPFGPALPTIKLRQKVKEAVKPAAVKPAAVKAAGRKAALKGIESPRVKTGFGARVLASLDDETSQSFVETPLEEALQAIAETHDIPIVVDARALEEIGLSPDTPVSIDLKNVTLRSFLRLMLRDLDLTYMIKDEVMQITTIETAETDLVLVMYIIPHVLVDKNDQVLKAMQCTVVPSSWETLGGPSTAQIIDDVLIVSSTSDVHDRVEQFLVQLDAAMQRSKANAR